VTTTRPPAQTPHASLTALAPLATLLILLLLEEAVVAGTARAASFADLFGSRLSLIRDAFATSVARSLPVTAASPGFVYTFDPATGAYERETAIAGQLYLERPDPVGKGRWNATLNYQRVDFDAFNGADIDTLHDVRSPIRDPTTGVPFTVPLLGLELATNEFTASATYGVTDDLDLNLTLPVLESKFRLRLRLDTPNNVTVPCQRAVCTFRDEALGTGDTFLRGRYRFFHGDWVHAAAGLVLRFPTGNEDNFQGGGVFEVAPLLYASTRRIPVGAGVHVQPYVNAGMNLDTGDVGQSEGRWGVGLDAGLRDRITLALALLGRHQFQRAGSAEAFDVERCLNPPSCTERGRAPLFGLENQRPDFYDLSVGLRFNVWGDVLIMYANVLVPLNDDGLRAEVIPLAGIEATL